MTIKMSDVFELPMIDHGRNNLVTDHSDETEAAILAINAYDDNQAEIVALTIDLRKSKEFNCGLADEINGLKAQVNSLKDGVTHFNASGGDLNQLLAAYVHTPRQCLASYRAKAITDAIANSEQIEFEGSHSVGMYVSLEDLEVNIKQLGEGS